MYFYRCLALYNYGIKNYEEALRKYHYLYAKDANLLSMNVILYFDCFEKCGRTKALEATLQTNPRIRDLNPNIKKVIAYYRMKSGVKPRRETLLKSLIDIMLSGATFTNQQLNVINEEIKNLSFTK